MLFHPATFRRRIRLTRIRRSINADEISFIPFSFSFTQFLSLLERFHMQFSKRRFTSPLCTGLVALLTVVATSQIGHADIVRVSITNNAPDGGVYLTMPERKSMTLPLRPVTDCFHNWDFRADKPDPIRVPIRMASTLTYCSPLPGSSIHQAMRIPIQHLPR